VSGVSGLRAALVVGLLAATEVRAAFAQPAPAATPTPLPAAPAPYQPSFVQIVPGGACEEARIYEVADVGAAAQHARRRCRLELMETRLAAERQQAVMNAERAQDERVETWMEATQPTRVLRPVSADVLAGTGLVSYGLMVSWDVLRRMEIAAWIGRHPITCAAAYNPSGGDCTRTAYGGHARWFFTEKDFTPFIGTGFAFSSSSLAIYAPSDPSSFGGNVLAGDGRAHSVDGSAGLLLSVRGLRLSLEYIFEYVYYTGANQNDMQKTPSEDLRIVWSDSLRQDRHGIRFQVGYAF
jgi:hypothetical protein